MGSLFPRSRPPARAPAISRGATRITASPADTKHRSNRPDTCRQSSTAHTRPSAATRRAHPSASKAPLLVDATVTTANGTIKAARTRLAMIELGGLVVRDVDAVVLPDEALSENLLGLSFLSKLKRFEYANGKMVLEQ